jgi:hypothetical protein
MGKYWQFYWPLTLTGLGLILAIQIQNGVLARFPDAVTELAIFALAYSGYGLCNAALNFTAQLSNVFARSPHATLLTHRFVIAASIMLTLALSMLAHTQAGAAQISGAEGNEATHTERLGE